VAIVVFVGILTFILVYNKKRESNEGRLLVYKVCFSEYAHTGILFKGIGYNKFQADYPLQLIDYSEKTGIEHHMVDNMANTFYAFNDYLQLFIEVGLLGAIIILLISGVMLKKIYYSYTRKWENGGFLLIYMASFLLLALIHYPFRVFEISKLFILTTIIITAKSHVFKYVEVKKSIGRFIFIILLIFGIAINGLYIYHCFKADSIDIGVNFRKPESKFKKASFFLDDNITFLRKHAAFYEFYGQNKEAIETYNKIMRESLTAEYYYKIGSLYFKDSFYLTSENNFTKATQLIPENIKFQLSLFEVQVKLKKCDWAKKTLSRIEEMIRKEPNLKGKKLIEYKISYIKRDSCFE
jgi:tetratricopeptide (TPR) repeat protein